LPGNVIDAGWVERQATRIDGRNQISGALFGAEWLCASKSGFEPEEGSFGEHVSSYVKTP
jgi:hypothetical protein